ncbi:glycoside hydrolase family 65 protein [Marinimicrobium agarilyticum]|uniref:glycoside hydrolase family 65 protein n=1 Tax=Marinimicrobium agarilyticum TaxID=306546 RepID=UPI0003FC4E73|nr:glycosyl hydrolase family 65 protein [Marinimicrobium agarilyticum]
MQHDKHAPHRPRDSSCGHSASWHIVEEGFSADRYGLNATLFALGNGYIGLRGTLDEGLEGHAAETGCYLNGVYYSEPITYGEKAYGYAKNNQRIAAAALPHELRLQLDGVAVDLHHGEVLEHRRTLAMDEGLLYRLLRWRSPDGHVLRLESRRLVSLVDRQLVLMDYRFSLEQGSGVLSIESALDASPIEAGESEDPRVGAGINQADLAPFEHQANGSRLSLGFQLRSTGFALSAVAGHSLKLGKDTENALSPVSPTAVKSDEGLRVACRYELPLEPNQPVTLTKYVLYADSHTPTAVSAADLTQHLATCMEREFTQYAEQQQAAMTAFWQGSDIEIGGDPSLQQGLRFNLFHLFQSVGRTPGTNIAAKGLTGHGYEGHYFWDSEIYILPFFLYTQPALARNLLMYRHSILDSARARARELAIPTGALFAWRTIGGEECSAYYPAGTAQFHINADIAYAIRHYHDATGDDDFLRDYGAEVVFESARLWPAIGHFNPNKAGRFCINEVTGPDEYTALVNNNFFTNAMAQAHLRYAVELYHWLQAQAPDKAASLFRQLSLTPEEISQWHRAADQMYLPYDEPQRIHLQDDSFLDKPRWDFANTPADHYPLLLHYHPLTIYRHQVCKQADTVLALFLLGEQFSLEQKKRDFDFYEPLTTHDSTLSACVHSILANELGYTKKARHYFEQVARMDLDNHHHNTQHGVHTACMGGTWLCMVQGFAGMRLQRGQLQFSPTLPKGLTHYRFKIQVRGRLVELAVDQQHVRYKLLEGAPLAFSHGGRNLTLGEPDATISLSLAGNLHD